MQTRPTCPPARATPPASTLPRLTANVSTVTAGQTAVALTACGACGPSSAYAYQSAQLTADVVLSEGNKLYSVSGADNLGTSASSTGANVQVDNTGPSLTTVIAATTGTSPQGFVKQGGTYRVYANATDLPSGSGNSSGVNAATLDRQRLDGDGRPDRGRPHRVRRLRPELGLRLPVRAADRRRGALGGEQALLGLRRRQPGHERELDGRERAGGQHRTDRGSRHRQYDDKRAGLARAGERVPRVCERH